MSKKSKAKYADYGRRPMTKNGRKPFTTMDSELARRRLAKGLSQHELADIIGCNGHDIYRWESGKNKPRADALLALAKALDCAPEDLIDG